MPDAVTDARPVVHTRSLGKSSPLDLIERERRVLGQIAAGVPLTQVLEDLLRAVEEQGSHAMLTSILFLSADGRHLNHGAAPNLPAAYNEAIDGIAIGEGIGCCGTAASRDAPVYVSNIATDPLWRDFRDLALFHGLRACWSTPIRAADGALLGTFAIYYDAPRLPTPDDIEAITFVTQAAALAIERHRHDLDLRRSQEKLHALNADLEAANQKLRERIISGQAVQDRLASAIEAARLGTYAWSSTINAFTLDARAREILGLPAHGEIGRDAVFATIASKDLERARVAAAESFVSGSRIEVEFTVLHSDGATRTARMVGDPSLDDAGDRSVVGVIQDISAQKQAEAMLLIANTTLAGEVVARTQERDRMWMLSRDFFAVVDRDGHYRSMNPTWGREFGFVPENLVGLTFTDLMHPDDTPGAIGKFESILGGSSSVEMECRVRRADGIYRTMIWTGIAEGDAIYCYGRDITEQRAAEAHSIQAQKLEAIGQLTGGIAHDFNNLLMVLKSSADLLKRHDLPEERRARYVAAISDTVDRAARLTGQLLAFARRQTLQPEVFDAARSVGAISEMMSTLTGARVQISTRLPDQPCYLHADPSQFDTALVNLAVNAKDAMDGAGEIEIAVRAVEVIPATRTSPSMTGRYVAVSIVDSGCGIPQDRIERIFEPFYTTKAVGRGTGLGLSQVFGFAQQSGGEVRVESAVGVGTTFTLYLPYADAPVSSTCPDTVAPEPLSLHEGHGTCVLVVEDNQEVGRFAVQILAELGYSTVLATDGKAALLEIKRVPYRFEVMFSDVLMPGMTGLDLAEEVRRRRPDMPIVLTSGYSHILAAGGTHGFPLLHKPYSIEQLSHALLEAVSRHRAPSG